jgi:Bromodomain/Bromodomain extra-terminal - transcription regulation
MSKLSEELQQCAVILKYLQGRQDAAAFLEPVDWEALGLPDYPQIVTDPMDLGTIDQRLKGGSYTSPDQFASDVRLVWNNAKTYNRPGSEIYITADALSKAFEKRFSNIKRTTPVVQTGPGGVKRKRTDAKSATREVSRNDRVKFCSMMNQLSSDQLGYIVSVIQKKSAGALNEDDDDELEIDVNLIASETLIELIQYASGCISSSSASKKRKR